MNENIIYGYGTTEPQLSPQLSAIADDIKGIEEGQDAPLDDEMLRILDLYKASEISPEEPVKPTDFLFSWEGVDFMPRENLISLKAPAKTGKTFALTAFATAFVLGDYQGLKCYARSNETLLFIDTEQARNSTNKVFKRIIANAPEAKRRVKILNVRTCSAEDRMKVTEVAIMRNKPTLIVIDGIADFVPGMDYNDTSKAEAVISRLAQIAEANNAVIITAIHTNKNDNNASGWLGKVLLQKCAAELMMTRKQHAQVRTIEITASRDKEVDAINVSIEDTPDGYGRIVIVPKEEVEQQAKESTCSMHRKKLIDLGIEPQRRPRAEFANLYRAKIESTGAECKKQSASNFITRCIKSGALVMDNGLCIFEY